MNGFLAGAEKRELFGRDLSGRTHRLQILQRFDEIGPEFAQAPFVINETAPAEDAFAELLGIEIKRGAQRLKPLIDLAGQLERRRACRNHLNIF